VLSTRRTVRIVEGNELLLQREQRRLGAVHKVELGQDVADVALDQIAGSAPSSEVMSRSSRRLVLASTPATRLSKPSTTGSASSAARSFATWRADLLVHQAPKSNVHFLAMKQDSEASPESTE
jgi:hypothetical protein